MIQISDLSVPLSYDSEMLLDIAAKSLHIGSSRIGYVSISKRSLNKSDKKNLYFKMVLDVLIEGNEAEFLSQNRDKRISKKIDFNYIIPKNIKLEGRPVVIGCGPAGLFASLVLAQAGVRPILLERGQDVDSRMQKVLQFWQTGLLDPDSNVQFGEGGAGTFSDGKLKTGLKDSRKMMILNAFVEAGAPSEILYLDKPHIGTDRLRATVKGIREKIISLGGEVHFNATLTDIEHRFGHVTGVGFVENGSYTSISTQNVILAIGHSARDTFDKLLTNGVYMEQKPFPIGVRIEHPQSLINKLQHGDFAKHPALGAADYRMVVHLKNGRGVYTFCMCPGGKVVAAATEERRLVTNGMSEYARDGENANTALFVTVDKNDLKSDHPLAGIEYQRKIEEAAFIAGGGGYKAPVQRLEDFCNKRSSIEFGDVLPTYLPGTSFAQVDSYLPEYITGSLRQAIKEMDDWMPGFYYPDALLTGAETRGCSPVRITRDDNLEAIGIKGLYPCGEGAGYAGGIISAAVDGVRCAERILSI